jgi:rare lipoprotein A (peptidoglycan hydrolase)
MPCAIRVLCALVLGAALFVPAQAFASPTGTTATYYHPSLHGLRMANGLPYNRWDPMIAANNWYPLGTLLKVTRQGSDQYIYVRVQDRGSRALTLDLSEAGFAQLGGLREGRIPIWLEVVTTIEGQGPRAVAPAPSEEDAPTADEPANLDAPAAPDADEPAGPDAPGDADTLAPSAADEQEDAPLVPFEPDPFPIARHIRALDGTVGSARYMIRL